MPAKKTTPSRVAVFLEAYAGSGSVTAAAKAAGIDKSMHYRRLETDAEYRKRFEALQDRVGQELEDLGMERVRNGFKRQLHWRGKPMKTKNGHLVYEVDFDTQLHLTMLKRFRPKLYREHVVQEHTGSINLVERLEAARARLVAVKRFRPRLYREHVVQEHTGSINLVERLEAARARLIAIKREDDKSAG